ncbi:MAG: hypothetical protein J6Q54_00740 [Oscillospiraceae bacterium]|nr:hypothetical protein [Oscillospiraceae bacterium]
MDQELEQVARQVLSKVEQYVDGVDPERLSPQAMKHITGVLKDLRDMRRESAPDTGVAIRVEFQNDAWNG